jgi:CRISPR/Cas system-associated exonuclease Cas4 (RecB family)
VLEGQSLHRALEILHRLLLEGTPPSRNELEHIFDRAWIVTDENKKKPEQKEKVGKVFRRYAQGVLGDNGARVVDVEHPFLASRRNDILMGKIDLLAERDGALEVVEFKYRRNPLLEEYTQHQLDHYRLAFPGQEIRSVLHYLHDDEREERECKDCDEVWSSVHQTFARIRERAFTPKPARKRCDPCPVKHVCVARTGTK